MDGEGGEFRERERLEHRTWGGWWTGPGNQKQEPRSKKAKEGGWTFDLKLTVGSTYRGLMKIGTTMVGGP